MGRYLWLLLAACSFEHGGEGPVGTEADANIEPMVVDCPLTYNVVTREFKVAALRGEARLAHTTRDLRDAQRILSDIRNVKMSPAGALDPAAVIYVRVNATTALNGENTFVARMNGTAEQTTRQSDYRTIQRVQ